MLLSRQTGIFQTTIFNLHVLLRTKTTKESVLNWIFEFLSLGCCPGLHMTGTALHTHATEVKAFKAFSFATTQFFEE